MQNLKLPSYSFRTAERNGRQLIFDENRRRWIVLTPEEWVRQHFIRFLLTEKKIPGSLMATEKRVLLNNLPRRFDLLVFDRKGDPLLIAEFKSPDVAINQAVFDQASRYNSVLKAPFFLISNGLTHFVGRYDFISGRFVYLQEIPTFVEMTSSVE